MSFRKGRDYSGSQEEGDNRACLPTPPLLPRLQGHSTTQGDREGVTRQAHGSGRGLHRAYGE